MRNVRTRTSMSATKKTMIFNKLTINLKLKTEFQIKNSKPLYSKPN